MGQQLVHSGASMPVTVLYVSVRKFSACTVLCYDVRFGSLADIRERIRDVCFTPESGHVQRRNRCLLCAKSGHFRLAENQDTSTSKYSNLTGIKDNESDLIILHLATSNIR
jgi:hypothetical protein